MSLFYIKRIIIDDNDASLTTSNSLNLASLSAQSD